jgi:hypothetical protein
MGSVWRFSTIPQTACNGASSWSRGPLNRSIYKSLIDNKGSSWLWRTPKYLLNTTNYTVEKGVDKSLVELWVNVDGKPTGVR